MNGILLIDKPAEWTSFDVVAKLRGAAHQKKVGHGGTLDPMATGVLPVLFGKATRLADILPDQTKRYTAEMQLGIRTDTYDTTGDVLERREPEVDDAALQRVAGTFRGVITQLPPMYSAVKVNGRRLYDLARQGREVERPVRTVEVISLTARLLGSDCVGLDMHCSKGTYVRSICHDMGEMLGCGAAMSALRRTASAGFDIEDCLPLDAAVELAREGELEARLLSLGAAFGSYHSLTVNDPFARLLLSGVRVSATQIDAFPGQRYRVYHGDDFIGIGEVDGDGLFVFKNLAL